MKILNVWIAELTSGSGLIVTLFFALLLLGMSTVPSAESAEVWVLTDTRVNPNNARTEFIGGVGDPEYYSEPRYLGKYELFTVTDRSITHRNKSVDHDYLYFDATFIARFDKPPAQMIAGETITLNATTEGSGYVSPYSGGWNAGIQFQYHADGVTLSGDSIAATNLDYISDTAKVNFDVPVVTAGGRIEISAGLWNCPACLVQYIYEPGTASEEGFILTNTGSEEVKINDVPLPQCSQSLQGFDRDVAVASIGCGEPIEESDRIEMNPKSKVRISYDCLQRVYIMLDVIYEEKLSHEYQQKLVLALLVAKKDPTICGYVLSNLYQGDGSNHISLDLQSGGGRFETVLEDLTLDIETDTAKISSFVKNDFAVGHNPDTDVTFAACYRGSVTVEPSNPTLPSVTLKTGKQVEVTRDSIGPITNIGQTISAPIQLLLDDGAK